MTPDPPNPLDPAPAAFLHHAVDCPACGYSLQGLPHLKCPECGQEFTPELFERKGNRRLRLVTVWASVAFLLASLVPVLEQWWANRPPGNFEGWEWIPCFLATATLVIGWSVIGVLAGALSMRTGGWHNLSPSVAGGTTSPPPCHRLAELWPRACGERAERSALRRLA